MSKEIQKIRERFGKSIPMGYYGASDFAMKVCTTQQADIHTLLAEIDRLEKELKDASNVIEDLTIQFAYEYKNSKNGHKYLTAGGLSALESSFDYLKWSDPKEREE